MESEAEILVALENHGIRLTQVEKDVKDLGSLFKTIQELTLSVNRLAINMENMLTEQKDQGKRIKALESEPADYWKSAKKQYSHLYCPHLLEQLWQALLQF